MFDHGREQLLLKLKQLFQGKEELISSGKLKVCLTAKVISFLNTFFDDSQQHSSSERHTIDFLKECVQRVHTLKIIPGPTFKYNSVVNISQFQAVQVLEITKLAIGYISGLQTLRPRIKVLKTSHSVDKLSDVLSLCGADESTAFTWPQLEVADFSCNTISQLDSSLRLLTSLQVLNLSHNELTSEGESWTYMPEVTRLDIGYNRIKKIPRFTKNCCSRITTLILGNNDLSSLEGLQILTNLESLDVSTNCITTFHSLSPLAHLKKLVLLHCSGNPISYHEDYRITVISYLSPDPRRAPIVLDGQKLSVEESYNLGHSLQLGLSRYIPSQPYGAPVDVVDRNALAHTSGDPEILVQSTAESAPRTPGEKGSSRKRVIRRRSIRNVGEDLAATSASDSDIVDMPEEFEQPEIVKKDPGEGTKANLTTANVDFHASNKCLVHNEEPPCGAEEHASDVAPTDPCQDELTTEDKNSLESPPHDKAKLQKEVFKTLSNVESDNMFLVVVNLPTSGAGHLDADYLFVIVKEQLILEHDVTHIKEICSLDLNSLIEINVIPTETTVKVQLKFDYVSKGKRFREYTMDDEKRCERFVALIRPFLKEPSNESPVPKKEFRCLKCSAWYSVDDDITVCGYCNSAMVVEVTQDNSSANALHQSQFDPSRTKVLVQSPDIIPTAVNISGVPPDICISSSDKSKSATSNEYGALVSSVKRKTKESCYEDTTNGTLDIQTTHGSIPDSAPRHSSSAVDISFDRLSTMHHKQSYGSTSPSLNSTSSSTSESWSSTSLGGRQSYGMQFSMDSCTHCDHRLKLYLETKMFKGGDKEEFCCMIKCPLVAYNRTRRKPSLLVISNMAAYICRILGFESSQPKEWLTLKVAYLLNDLCCLEYGLKNQSFRLEFAQPGACFTYLVGDSQRCEDFLRVLRNTVKKVPKEKKFLPVFEGNRQTSANIRIQVFGVKDESLVVKGQRLYEQVAKNTFPPLVKDRKTWFRSLPQSMLGEEFIDWLVSRKEASNYREAVQVAQQLLDAGIIQCFNSECKFLEKDQYYHFKLSEDIPKSDDVSQDNSMESSEVDITIKQYVLASWRPSSKMRDNETSVPVSIIVTNTHIALTKENHQWPLPRFHEPSLSLSGPQFVLLTKQKITNITDVELFAESSCDIGIEFLDEDTPGNIEEDRWLLTMETDRSVERFLGGLREQWKGEFGVELPVIS